MKPGDIIFVRRNNWLGKLIRYFDKGDFSHVAIALNENHIIDARLFRGVQIRHFDFKDYEVVRVSGTDLENVKQFIGRKYDLKQFVGYGLSAIWNNPKNLICSELVAHLLLNNKYLNLKPNELYETLKML